MVDRRRDALEANSAVQKQLSTLPPPDQSRTQRALTRLVENPDSSSPVKRRVSADSDLWEVKISPQLRALVRIERDTITVLAVARHDELEQYLHGRLGH
jgi:mRNA-degrading endonuclease RelE of RelBE toxin-antitoxin system